MKISPDMESNDGVVEISFPNFILHSVILIKKKDNSDYEKYSNKMHTIYQFLKQLLKLGEIKTEYPLIPNKEIDKE